MQAPGLAGSDAATLRLSVFCFWFPAFLPASVLCFDGYVPAGAALPRLDPIRAGSRASINKPRDLRPEAEETVSLWNLTDSLIEKLASGSYMVPPRDDGQEVRFHPLPPFSRSFQALKLVQANGRLEG